MVESSWTTANGRYQDHPLDEWAANIMDGHQQEQTGEEAVIASTSASTSCSPRSPRKLSLNHFFVGAEEGGETTSNRRVEDDDCFVVSENVFVPLNHPPPSPSPSGSQRKMPLNVVGDFLNEEDNNTIGTGKSFPSTYEMGDMAEDNNTIGTGKSFPSTYEMGDMADEKNDSNSNMGFGCNYWGHDRKATTTASTRLPLKQQEQQEQQEQQQEPQQSKKEPQRLPPNENESSSHSASIRNVQQSLSLVLDEVNKFLIRSPALSKLPVRTEAAIRSRRNKRTLEEQLRNWQKGVGTNRPVRRYSTGSQLSKSSSHNKDKSNNNNDDDDDDDDDGPPALMDCASPVDEDEVEVNRDLSQSLRQGRSCDEREEQKQQEQQQNLRIDTTRNGKDRGNKSTHEAGRSIGLGRRFNRRNSTGGAPVVMENNNNNNNMATTATNFLGHARVESFETEPNVFRSYHSRKGNTVVAMGEENDDGKMGLFDPILDWSTSPAQAGTTTAAAAAAAAIATTLPPIRPSSESQHHETTTTTTNIIESSFPSSLPFQGEPLHQENFLESTSPEIHFRQGRRASMGSITSKSSIDDSLVPKTTNRRGSLSTIGGGGGFSSPDRPPLSRTAGTGVGAGFSPPIYFSSSPTNSNGGTTTITGRRPSLGSGSVASVRTGYSSNCDASRSSIGSSRVSVGSDGNSRIVLVRGNLVRDGSRSSLGSASRFLSSDASRTSSIGSGRPSYYNSDAASRSSFASSKHGLDSSRSSIYSNKTEKTDPMSSSDCSVGSPTTTTNTTTSARYAGWHSRYQKGHTLEEIRTSARQGCHSAPASPAATSSGMSLALTRTGAIIKSPGAQRRKVLSPTSQLRGEPSRRGLLMVVGENNAPSPKHSLVVSTRQSHVAEGTGGINNDAFSSDSAASPLSPRCSTRRKHKGRERSGSKSDSLSSEGRSDIGLEEVAGVATSENSQTSCHHSANTTSTAPASPGVRPELRSPSTGRTRKGGHHHSSGRKERPSSIEGGSDGKSTRSSGSGKGERRASLSNLVGSLSPRGGLRKERRSEKLESSYKRDPEGHRRSLAHETVQGELSSALSSPPNKASRRKVSRNGKSRITSKDGGDNATTGETYPAVVESSSKNHKERRSSMHGGSKSSRRRGSLGETSRMVDKGRSSDEVVIPAQQRRFRRRGSTGSTDGDDWAVGSGDNGEGIGRLPNVGTSPESSHFGSERRRRNGPTKSSTTTTTTTTEERSSTSRRQLSMKNLRAAAEKKSSSLRNLRYSGGGVAAGSSNNRNNERASARDDNNINMIIRESEHSSETKRSQKSGTSLSTFLSTTMQ